MPECICKEFYVDNPKCEMHGYERREKPHRYDECLGGQNCTAPYHIEDSKCLLNTTTLVNCVQCIHVGKLYCNLLDINLCSTECHNAAHKDNPNEFKFTEAVKYDDNKLKWYLLPWDALEEVVKVYTVGSKKYAERNWEKGFTYSRLYGALLRHLVAWFQRGERNDSDSGVHHLAAVAFCTLGLLAFEIRKTGTDDRPKGSRKNE